MSVLQDRADNGFEQAFGAGRGHGQEPAAETGPAPDLGKVRAQVYDDEGLLRADFDAARALEAMSDADILALSADNWAFCMEADSIAFFYEEENPEVAAVLNLARERATGFAVEIDFDQAWDFVRAHRPQLVDQL